jgi:hypothetical protein
MRLVTGSYPPVPGAPAAATVAAVRRAWAQGREVVVVSPRVSAAPEVAPLAGLAAGRVLARLRREHGCPEVVVCMEPGLPFPLLDGAGGAAARLRRPLRHLLAARAARRLAGVLAGFESAEVVVTGDLAVPGRVLALLWPAVNLVTAGSEETARALRAAGAPFVRVVEPFAGAGLAPPLAGPAPPRAGVPLPGGGVLATTVQPAPPRGSALVTPLGPADVLLRQRARRLAGAVARKVLGRRAPALRFSLQRLARLARLGRPARPAPAARSGKSPAAKDRPHAGTDGSQDRRRSS